MPAEGGVCSLKSRLRKAILDEVRSIAAGSAFVFILMGSFAGHAASGRGAGFAPRVFTLNVVGGGPDGETLQSFYRIGAAMHRSFKELEIPKNRMILYAGEGDRKCYSRIKKQVALDDRSKQVDFSDDLNDCSKAKILIQDFFADDDSELVCNQPPAAELLDLDDFDGDGKKDVRGLATSANVAAAFKGLLNPASGPRGGDHLFVNLNDHGSMPSSAVPDWHIWLGPKKDTLSATTLASELKPFTDRGVIVHLNVEACYSGGFNKLTDVSGRGATSCVVTDSDAKSIATTIAGGPTETFDLRYAREIGQKRSQLRAFACALGGDADNRPRTSLDFIVEDWEAQAATGAGLPKCEIQGNLSGLSKQIDKLLESLAQTRMPGDERGALIKAYKRNFADLVASCARDRKDEQAYAQALKRCLKEGKMELDASMANQMLQIVGEDLGEPYDVQMIARHLRFLRNADAVSLSQFRKAFCCLSYDLKTGESPDVCPR